tara:strand:- start:9884 stop:10453 length:570 start_codon:yes stop_codon:yes gene_type:complete
VINRFKNTKLFIDGFSKELIKLVKLEIDKNRTRTYASGTYNSPIKAFGKLSNSIKPLTQEKENEYSINIEANSYGKYLDDNDGSPRKAPPVSEILKWLKKKTSSLKDAKGKIISLESTKAKGIAYAISRKIGRENVQKTGFISSALNESLSILNKLPDSVVKDVKLNLQDILEKAGYYKKGETYNINVE